VCFPLLLRNHFLTDISLVEEGIAVNP
jgi:hypothetical protein